MVPRGDAARPRPLESCAPALLGLHPGTEVDGYAAAALDGTDLAAARRGLGALYDQCLLTEPAQGRYRLHHLVGEHARALAGRDDPDGDRDQATARLLDYYQHVGSLAEALLARQARTASAPAAGAMPAAVPALADRDQALPWARAERANLIGCLDHATGTGQHARIVALTAGIAGLLRQDGPWAEAITRHATALRAARQLGDRPGQANALNNLGDMRRLTGDYPDAARDLEEALGMSPQAQRRKASQRPQLIGGSRPARPLTGRRHPCLALISPHQSDADRYCSGTPNGKPGAAHQTRARSRPPATGEVRLTL